VARKASSPQSAGNEWTLTVGPACVEPSTGTINGMSVVRLSSQASRPRGARPYRQKRVRDSGREHASLQDVWGG
jgi:hypothetical protein